MLSRKDLWSLGIQTNRPDEDSSLSNEKWNGIFDTLKKNIKPSDSDLPRHYNSAASTYSDEEYFIVDTLDEIRRGKHAICFTVLQIANLLLYEHDRLLARLLPDHSGFIVTLET